MVCLSIFGITAVSTAGELNGAHFQLMRSSAMRDCVAGEKRI
jgi:hypothetical protein